MSSDFEKAVEFVLKHEGGYSNHANDSGGPTNFGISLRLLEQQGIDIDGDGDIDIDDIKGVTKARAKQIYKELWWDKYRYELIEDQNISQKVFDMAVNMGAIRGHKILQSSINSIAENDIVVDGVIGNITRRAITRINPKLLYKTIQSEQASFYLALIAKKPQLESFKKGWLNRAKQ